MPRLAKPPDCSACPGLGQKGLGYAPADGPAASWLLLVGEALGAVEALTGKPFVGDAGGMLSRLLKLLGWDRAALRIDNTIRCFPGDTIIEASAIQRGYRRWYEGSMVTVVTREGILSGTPNHPVLTPRGWVALGDLHTSDHLIRGTIRQRMPWRDPDVQYRPPTFSQVFETLADTGIGRRVVGRSVDFHGDGLDGDVEVVTTDGILRVATDGSILQEEQEIDFTDPDLPPAVLVGSGACSLYPPNFSTGVNLPTRRCVGGRYEGRSSLRVKVRPSHSLRVAASPDRHPSRLDGEAESRLSDVMRRRESFYALPTPITLAEISEIRRDHFAGHVYNLQTGSEQYVANGFIVHNCQPPGDWFDERAPWYHSALAYCPYLERESLAVPPQVVVTMGQTALKRVMGLQHARKVRVQDWHGAIVRDPTDRYWVVPTYHPSYLQRGAHNLIGTVLWDLQRAEIARDQGQPPRTGTTIIDPPLDWFTAWVDQVVAARTQDPYAYPLSSDVETPDKAGGKDEGEITADDRSFQIVRQNFACHPDEGITVPNVGGYLDQICRLYASPGPIWQWNREYDFQRLVAAGQIKESQSAQVIDLMWLAHVLQSDLPRGLGFWAPFYSDRGPWKHLADSQPAVYGGEDGIQTHRIGFGLYTDLQRLGMFATAMRHTHALHTAVLRPAQLVGVKIDRPALLVFKGELADKARSKLSEIQRCVPESLQPLTPKGGMVRKPLDNLLHTKASPLTRKGTVRAGKPVPEIKQELYAKAIIVEKTVLKEVLTCGTCGVVDIQRRHRCRPDPSRDETAAPRIELAVATVTRYFWREPFNPDSPTQVLAYIRAKKHAPGRTKKTGQDSTDRETLKRLTKTGDPFYHAVLDYRAITKVKGTYVEGTERRLDDQDRLHPQPTFRPSTMRLSYVNPNITNVVADKDEHRTLAAGFRRCVVAEQGCALIEVDFSAIEAVQTGWCARDPFLMRLATLGIHSYLIAKRLNDAPDLTADDQTIRQHLKQVKKAAGTLLYDQVKHTVYGVLYGQTPYGLCATWPDLYPDLKTAEAHIRFLFDTIPSIPIFQRAVLDTAHADHQLGGSQPYAFSPGSGPSPRIVGHPFAYRHWFWSIYTYKRLTLTQALRAAKKGSPTIEIGGQSFRVSHGPDANRAIAFYPQSIASGDLKEALLRLLADRDSPNYIGDLYYGQTPLRAPIHDSGLFEVPIPQVDRALEAIVTEMTAPILQQPNLPVWNLGAHLRIGVAAKVGFDWASCEERPVGGSPIAEAVASLHSPMEVEDAEDFEDLGRAV